MVYYHDEQGKIHYVNTDFAKVPDKYMYQVIGQLDEPKLTPAKEEVEVSVSPTPANQPPEPKKQTASVKVYVSDTCGEACSSFELALQVRNIVYQRVDITKDPEGKKLYEMTGGTAPLPITCVNVTKCLIGPNVVKFINTLQEVENANR